MKTLLAIILLTLGFLAYGGDGQDANIDFDATLAQEKNTTKWEDDNKYVPQSVRTTSSMSEESATESDQVEYVVIEE